MTDEGSAPDPAKMEEAELRAYEDLFWEVDLNTDWEKFWREAAAALGAAGYRMGSGGKIIPPGGTEIP